MTFYELEQQAIKSVDDGVFTASQGLFSIAKLEWYNSSGDGYKEYYATTMIDGYRVTEWIAGDYEFTYGDSAPIKCKSIQDGMDKCQALFELCLKIYLKPRINVSEIPMDKLKTHKY